MKERQWSLDAACAEDVVGPRSLVRRTQHFFLTGSSYATGRVKLLIRRVRMPDKHSPRSVRSHLQSTRGTRFMTPLNLARSLVSDRLVGSSSSSTP